MRRLGAAAVLAVGLAGISGQAGAIGHLPTLSINDVTVAEGGLASFTVTLSAKSLVPVTVTATTTDDTATAAGLDYTSNRPAGAPVTIPAGALTASFTVQTLQDNLDEIDETFFVDLSAAVGATIADGRGGATIIDDDIAKATISPVAVTAVEGNQATFNVSLSNPSSRAVTVTWVTENGGTNQATAGSDYTQVTAGSTTFPARQTGPQPPDPQPITVQTLNDTLDEFDETFNVRLTSANTGANTKATLGSPSVGTVTIKDLNGVPPTVSISDVSLDEGNSGTVDFIFEVKLSGPSGKPIKVSYATAPGTASNDVDFTPASGELTFLPGSSLVRTITVQVKGDVLSEPDETFVVNLFGLVNVTPGRLQGLGTIKNDDADPVPTFRPFTQPLEGNPPGTTDLTLTLERAPSAQPATFDYRLVAGSATAGVDYRVPGSTTVSFPASTTPVTRTIAIPIVGDALDENDETFTVEVVRPAGGVVVASAAVIIRNDDNNSKLSITDASADEPRSGNATMKFTVTLSPASGRAVSVNWATADGTATAGVDYTAGSGALSFAPGETSKEIVVSVTGDEINEENETVLVKLSGPAGAVFATGGDQGQGTIIDRNAPPSLSVSDTVAREGGSGAEFTVTLAGTTLRTVTVRFGTGDGTAKAGDDYVARVGTLTFAPGEKTKAIAVTVIDDTDPEVAEDFYVSLGDAVNGTITKSLGAATIEASDQAPTTTPKPPTADRDVRPVARKTTLLPQMLLGPRTVTIGAAGVARMLVTCAKASPITCSGSVALETVAKPKFQLGKKTFSVKKGTKVYVSIRLSARSLKQLKLKGTLQATAIVIVKTSAKSLRVVPGVITLKLKPGTKIKVAAPPLPPTKVFIDSP